jgi:hemerythrin superfamily protein
MYRHPALVPLSRQHFDALALCVLVERSLSEDTSEKNIRRLANKIGAAQDVELANHFQLEEELIFPKLPNALASELIAEHRSLEKLIKSLRANPSVNPLEQFVSDLRSHARKEENVYFQEFQASISEEELAALLPQLESRALRACLTDIAT